MAKARNNNFPQHDMDQGHYGELLLNMLPSATGLPSGTIFVWDGDSFQYGVQTGSGGGDTVKVSSNDTTSGYLNGKLVAGAGVSLTENNDGGNETLTIANLGGGGFSAEFIGCKIYNSGTQSINNTTTTPITFNLEEFDSSGFHSTSSDTSRITIPTGYDGKYLIGGMTSWDTNATGERYMRFKKNGSLDIRGSHVHASADAGGPKQETAALVDLVAGDYVELNVFQDSGGSRTVGAGAGSDLHMSTAWAYRVSANSANVTATALSGSSLVEIPGLALGDRKPSSAGTYDEEFDGTRNTLPSDWAWASAPTGSDTWTLNSRWPSMLTVEGTGNTDYTLSRTSFTAASTFGIWIKVHVGPFIAADACGIRMYVSNSAVNELRGVNYRATGNRTGGIRALKIVGGAESVWGTEVTSGINGQEGPIYLGITRDGSNNFTSWFSGDGVAWHRLATAESHTITIDRIRFTLRTTTIIGLVGLDWVRYRTDNAFPRP